MIILKNLSKIYDNKIIFKDINKTIFKGEIIGIIGPSGAGKSTLLRCINYLDIPSSGKIFIMNEEINEKNIENIRGHKIGMVFQNFNLFEHFSVIQNIEFALKYAKKMNKKTAHDIAYSYLEKVGMIAFKDKLPKELSGGQKQRCALARTLAMEPQIILFDEPTSALDPENVVEVMKVISEIINSGITCLIVSHMIGMIRELANRIWFIDEGKLLIDENRDNFFINNNNPKIINFLNMYSKF